MLTKISMFLLFLFPIDLFTQDIHPIVDATNKYLLGGVMNQRVLDADSIALFMQGKEKYKLYSLSGFLGIGKGTKPSSAGEPCENTLIVNINPEPKKNEYIIAINGEWNAYPKKMKFASVDQNIYRDITSDILKAEGIKKPKINLTQVIRLDMDNDGKEEVLITATFFDGGLQPEAHAGDYSLVYLRKIINNKVENIIIAGEFYPAPVANAPPNEYIIAGLLDVDGDGKTEVIIHSKYYEGNTTTIYRITGRKVEVILSSGCGA